MLNISKDQVRRLLLVVIAFVALVYIYTTFFLGPLNHQRDTMISAIGDDETRLMQGAKTLKEAVALEKAAQDSVKRMAQLNEGTPPGAPVAWFPPLMKSFFARDGIEIGLVRLLGSIPFKKSDVTEYAKTDWTVEIPQVDFSVLGSSLARLENERLLSNITSVHIHAIPDHPDVQSVRLGMIRVLKE